MLKKLILIAAIVCSLNSIAFPAVRLNTNETTAKVSGAKDEKVRQLIRAAMEAMGGEAKLRELASVNFEGIGHNFAVEQSERPEGPFIVAYEQVKEVRDLKPGRLRKTTEIRQGQIPAWSGSTLIVADNVAAIENGTRSFPGSPVQLEDTRKKLALAPERLLLTAYEAADLRLDKDKMMQSVSQRVVKFTWEKIPVTIYLNSYTNLPTMVETLSASPYEHFWSIWGDFSTKTFYSYWTLERGGLRYPHQWDTQQNDYTMASFTVTNLKLNDTVADDLFKISDDARKAFANARLTKIDDLPLGRPDRPAAEIAAGIIKVPGRWDIAYVRQPDGIVIIESPISSGYSVKVLDEAKKRFPNEKIKAVVTTSDAFPHFGGVREYAAQKIPIYALDVNRPIIEKVLSAPHTFYPDDLQRKPEKANLKIVSAKTVLGSGANRMDLYPIRSESGERMMMIYFPEHKLLYSSDLVQKGRDGSFFMPQYLTEIMDAVKRENLVVENTFGMHLDKTAWSEITAATAKQIAGE